MEPETSALELTALQPAGKAAIGGISGTVLSCAAQSWPGPGGRIMVLRVVGEIDLLTVPMLQSALDAALFGAVDHPTHRVVVDLAGVTFCNVRGLVLLADTAVAAAANATGYALSGCSTHLERCWRIMDIIHPNPDNCEVTRYVSTAAAVIGGQD